jgi:hypothetical protein
MTYLLFFERQMKKLIKRKPQGGIQSTSGTRSTKEMK